MWIPPAPGLRHSVCLVAAPGSQSPQLLASGHTSPQGCGPTPVAGTDHHVCTHTHTPAPHTCTEKRALTQGRAGGELKQQMGQTVVIRAGPGQASILTSELFTRDRLFLSPYSSVFPHLFLPKSPSSIPLPTLGSSPGHPVISLVQSQAALPLHP